MTYRIPTFVLAGCLLGCAVDAPDTEATAAAGGKADGIARSVVARYCEAFVDKAAIASSSQSSSRYLQTYLKVLNDRLDGDVVEAGFTGGRTVCASCDVGESGGYTTTRPLFVIAHRFLDAPDYFEMTLPVGLDDNEGTTVKLQGQFYVLTDQGTRYTVRADPDDHAMLDRDLDLPAWHDDISTLQSIGSYPTYHPARLQLDPDGCL